MEEMMWAPAPARLAVTEGGQGQAESTVQSVQPRHGARKPTTEPVQEEAQEEEPSQRSGLEGTQNHGGELLQKFHLSTCPSSPSPKPPSLKKPFRPRSCRLSSSWAVRPKNALVHLNELQPGLRFEILPDTPKFCAAVELNGLKFEGKGPTKKQAKMKAAQLALRSFIQFPNASQAHAAMGKKTWDSVDFTQDDMEPYMEEVYEDKPYNELRLGPHKQRLSPVVLLNRLCPGLKFSCVGEGLHRGLRRFVMVLKLEGRVFEGCGRSKRLAKARAAASALYHLYSVSLEPERRTVGIQGDSSTQQLPQFFAESIFDLVTQKYREVCSSTSSHLPHKGLAGIVMTRGFDLRSAQVVAVATGTKCVSTVGISDDGLTVRDCHAEVLSRRALLLFLYTQLEILLREPPDAQARSIFVPGRCGGVGLRLRKDVHFHMFISCSPCGDARLHCPYQNDRTTPLLSRRWRCGLRVKVNGGEGTLPQTTQPTNQLLSGASPQKPRLSMSCTDKMAKWSVVGLQGALLSHLVEPIYLSSVTVATLTHTGHMSRVMWRRLATVKHLPYPYRRRPLLLGCVSRSELCPGVKSVNVSVNWTHGEGSEVISVNSGLRLNSETPSRLCPSVMFNRWKHIYTQISDEEAQTTKTHVESKMSAVCYQRALRQFIKAVQRAGLGSWTRGPLHLSY